MRDLSEAIAFAAQAFRGMTDRGGKPYIMHCLWVMDHVHTDDEYVKQAAVLHDVIEDTEIEAYHLQELGFAPEVIDLVLILTHRDYEDYTAYIDRVKKSQEASLIKRADLRHNSDITRLKGVRPKDLERVAKYHEAYKKLGG